MLFQVNGKSIKFHLKDISEEESLELTELVKKNGGEVNNNNCNFIFTNPDKYNGEKTAFDTKYIYDCIRVDRILNLDDYIIRRKEMRSCLTMLFTTGEEHCHCPTYPDSNLCRMQIFIKEYRNTTFNSEHNYVTRDPVNESQLRILSTEQMGDTPFSDSIYNPDETQLEQSINRDKNIEIQMAYEVGNTQVSDSIYNPDDTQSQLIDGEMNINLIDNVVEVPSTSNGPKIQMAYEVGNTQVSDSIYNPDDTQSQLIDGEMNINLIDNVVEVPSTSNGPKIQMAYEVGNTQVSDSIYNPDDTQSQLIDGEMNINLIDNVVEVPSTSNGPNGKFSFEISQTFEPATSSDLNVETYKDVCNIKEEPCFEEETETIIRNDVIEKTETVQDKEVAVFNEFKSSSETEAEDMTHKNPKDIEIVRERINESSNDRSQKLQISNSPRLSGTSECQKPSVSKKGKMKTGLRCKNTEKLTASSSTVGDTVNILCDVTTRSKSTKESTRKNSQVTDNSRVISDSETDYDEVTLDQRQKTKNKRTVFESKSDSDENYSPLIDSDFISDSDSPKSRKKEVQTCLTKKNVSKPSSDETTTMVTSTKSDQLSDRLCSSDDDSPPERVRKWKRIELPSCSRQSEPSRSQPTTIKIPKYATRNFMPWEQKEMVTYLIKNDCISGARGNNVWKQMIFDGHLKHRTFQSLQNHFRKFILPNIHRYSMNSKSREEFVKLQSH